MEMSEDSHSNGSVGSLRGLKSLFGKKEKAEAPEPLSRYDQNPSKTRKPSVLGGFQSRREDYTPGIPGLDRFGYEKYNVMESEIYISRPSESMAFDDMEPTIIRATNGNVVGSMDEVAPSEPAEPVNRVSQLYDPFESIDTGSSLPRSFGCVHGTVRDGEIVRDNAAPEIPKVEYVNEIEEDGFVFKPVSDEPEQASADESAEVPVEEPVEMLDVIIEEPEADASFDVAVESEEIRSDIADIFVENAEIIRESDITETLDAPMEGSEDFVEPMEASAMEPEEVPMDSVEAPVEEFEEHVPETEASVEVPVVVVPSLPENKFEGLYSEGESSDTENSVVDHGMSNTAVEPEAAETSASGAEPQPKPAPIAGIDMEGASVLPPMSVNPAKPRIRFKFINGVLTKVIEEEPAEPDEGLRGPFDIAAGQAVERIGPARPKVADEPFIIEMDDEFDSVPEPEYGYEAFDDALESLTFDAVPPTVIAELIDLMPISHPELDVEIDWSCPCVPDEDLEAVCFAEPVRFEVPELPVMIGAASEPLMIGAAENGTLMIEASEAETLRIGPAETQSRIAAPAQSALPAPAVAPEVESIINGVVFSFGSSTGAGKVTFSF